MRNIAWLTLSLLFLLPVSLLGQKQKIVFTTHWLAQSQFAGYYAAQKLGFYKDAGLDVVIKHPSASENTLTSIEKGKTDIINFYLSQSLLYRAMGHPLINIMQTSQQSSLLFVCRYPVKRMEDLNKYRIGVWSYLPDELVSQACAKLKLNKSRIVRFSQGVYPFLAKALDVLIICSYNELIYLKESGYDAKYILRLSDFGYNIPEEGLYVTEKYYKSNQASIQKFVSATRKGWDWVNTHRKEALAICMEQVRKNHVGTNEYHQRMQLDEVLRLQLNKQGKRTFKLSRQDFDNASHILINRPNFTYNDFVK